MASINVFLPISPIPIGLLTYLLNLGGKPAYIGLIIREGGPGRNRLVLGPIHLLSYIGNLLSNPLDDLGPGVAP